MQVNLFNTFSVFSQKIDYKNSPIFYGTLLLLGLVLTAFYILKNKLSLFQKLPPFLRTRITYLWLTYVKKNCKYNISNSALLKQKKLDYRLLEKISGHVRKLIQSKGLQIDEKTFNIDQKVNALEKSDRDRALSTIVNYCFEFTDVCLNNISHRTIISLAKYSNLTSLSLQKCKEITDDEITQILLRCIDLTFFSLDTCPKITDQGINSLRICTKLKSLKLSNLNITDRSIITVALSHYFIGEESNLKSKYEGLTHVDLKCLNITDKAIRYLAMCSPKLTSVCLLCPMITDSGIIFLAKGCPELTFFKLVSDQVTDAAIRILANHCTKLTHLTLLSSSKISGRSIQFLAEGCPRLSVFTFDSTILVTQTAMFHLNRILQKKAQNIQQPTLC